MIDLFDNAIVVQYNYTILGIEMKHQEHILALRADSIHKQMPVTEDAYIGMYPIAFEAKDLVVAIRAGLELDPSHRQPITYAVVKSGDRYAAYRRAPSGGEGRLHGMLSIGFGGHVDVADLLHHDSVVDIQKTFQQTMEREIEEELDLNGATIVSYKLLDHKIVSNMSPVDAVHIGIVAVVELDQPIAKSGENALDFLGFYTLEELSEMSDPENWTKVLIEYLKS